MKTKKAINRIGIRIVEVVMLILFYSCSNDYLHEKQKLAGMMGDTIYMSDLETVKAVNFNLPQGGNAHWRILQFPLWMEVTPLEGNFTDSRSSFQLSNLDKIGPLGVQNLPLIFDVEGIGLVEYPFIFMNFGMPRATLSYNNLPLNYQSMGNFSIQNVENGILVWEIIDKPSWLTLSKQNGILNRGEEDKIAVIVSRDNLAKGDYSGEINIACNGMIKSLKVQVSMKVFDPTMSGSVVAIEGEVVDAEYCKTSGLMVIAAKNPNRIYFLKPGESMTSLDLNKIPINVTISETGDQIAGTFTNTDLSLISSESRTITKNIPTGIIASDVALGNNGWAYISPKQYDSYYLQSVDLVTGQMVKNNTYLSGLSLIRKVPGKNMLYGSKVGWSPDFLIVFDITNGSAKNVVDEWRVDLSKFWFSEDGARIFTGVKKIYNSPNYLGTGSISEKPVLAGEFEVLSGSITSMDHCSALKELFVVYKSFYYETGTQVLRFDDSGFFRKEAFGVGNCFVNENGNILSLAPDVPYMFVNKSGNELHLIKKGNSNSGKAYWFYEKISLK